MEMLRKVKRMKMWHAATTVLLIITFMLLASALAYTAATPKGKVSIAYAWGGVEAESFNLMLDKFEEEYPGIKIERMEIPGGEFRDFISAKIAAGIPPDVVIHVLPGWLEEMVGIGEVLPLDDLWDDWVAKGWYTEGWRNMITVNDHQYGAWIKASGRGLMWYTTAEFRELGVEEPKTWSEFTDLLERLKEEGKQPLLIGGKDGWPCKDWFETVLLRTQGPEVHAKLVRHEIAWNDPAVRETLEVIKDWIEKGYFQEEKLAYGFYEAFLKRTRGEAVLQHSGGWINGMTQAEFPMMLPGVDFTFFPMPAKEDIPFVESSSLDYMVILKNAKNIEEAKTVVSFLTGPDAQVIWAERGGYIAPNAKVLLTVYDLNSRKEAGLMKAADIILFNTGLIPTEMEYALTSELQRFWDNPALLDEVLNALESEAQRIYGK